MTDKRLKPEESLKDEWQELEAYFSSEETQATFKQMERDLDSFFNSEETKAAFREMGEQLKDLRIGGAEDGEEE